MSQHQAAFDCAHHAWEEDLDLVSSQETCLGLLTQIAHLVNGCTFVIDGLDECTYIHTHNTSATAFLEAITTALSTTSSRILLVSRDEPHIRNATSEHFTEYTILADDVRADTASVSQEIINRKLNKKPDEFRNSLSETMTTRCGGQFLWLRLQEDSLRNGMNMKKLKSVVEGTPPGLEGLYEREWSRIVKSPDHDRILSLLRWTAFAIRPLTVGEITEAVLIGEFDDFPMDDLPDEVDDDYVETEVIGLCAPLIQLIYHGSDGRTDNSVELRTVHLAHFSVKQFLLLQLPAPGTIRINEGLKYQYQNTLLATACLQYINFRHTWKDESDHQSALGVAFRNYAAGSWHHHFHAGFTKDETVLNLITALFDERNWVWGFWRSWLQKQDDGSFTASNPVTADGVSSSTWWDGEASGPIYYAIALGLESVSDSLMTEYTSCQKDMLDLARAAVIVTQQGGRQEMLEKLLQSGVSAKTTTKDGTTLLHFAACHNSPEVVQILIDRGADVAATNNVGLTALHFTRNVEVTRTLLQNGAMVDVPMSHGATLLHQASTSGFTEIVELLLDSGAAVDARNGKDSTPLHLACWSGHTEVAKRLLAKGASLTATCAGSTSLFMACIQGHHEIVKLLVREGASLDDAWTDGTQAIHCASSEGQLETVRLLLDLGASIDTRDNRGDLPLHLACQKGDTEVIKLLVDAGADIEALDGNGFTPLAVTCLDGHVDAMEQLMAAGNGISRIMKSHGVTLLNSAISKGHTRIINFLIDKGVNVAEPDKEGSHAIIYATTYGHAELVELFIQKGASISVTNEAGWTPLHIACGIGYPDIAQILLNAGSDLTLRNNGGETYLHLACLGENLDLVKTLVERGLGISDTALDGSTPLICAAAKGSVEIVEFLIANGARLDQMMKDSTSATDMAAIRGQLDILNCLVQASPKDAINDTTTETGKTQLHMVAMMNRVKSVKTLLDITGIDPNKVDTLGRTALLVAARLGHDDIVQVLVDDVRVDPNIRDWHGSTPLFAAVRNGHSKTAESLLKCPRVATEERDGFGKDLWWWAEKIGNSEVLSLLQQYLARKGRWSFYNSDAVGNLKPPPFEASAAYCDACLITTEDYHSCSHCGDRSFCLCPACFQMDQVQCSDGIHMKKGLGTLLG